MDAVARLAAGEIVAFPTETVYGLGADARRPEAVIQIFERKGPTTLRPADRSHARAGRRAAMGGRVADCR